MANSDQIKSLISSYGEGNDDKFFSSALQIAASEARKGHSNLAQELKKLIEKAKNNKSLSFADRNRTIPILHPKRELKELLDVFTPRIKLSNMVLESELKKRVTQIIIEQKNWQKLEKFNLSPRRKILLTGPPGCGKTMTAQAIAGELGLPIFIMRLDGVVSKYMGESVSKLKLIFDAMVENRGVYLFDEFDSIGSRRAQNQDVGEIKRILNSFLVYIEQDQSNSLIIAATNLPEELDEALFRRFDDVIRYPLPNIDSIVMTLEKAFSDFVFSDEVLFYDIAKLALGLNFSEIVKATEDTIKHMILQEKTELSKQALINAIKQRKIQ